jgi:hypothetical protein
MRYTVSEDFAQATIKHITKQVFDHNSKMSKIFHDVNDDLNDAFWDDCATLAKNDDKCKSCSNGVDSNDIDSNDVDYSDMPPLIHPDNVDYSDIPPLIHPANNDYSDMPPLVSP